MKSFRFIYFILGVVFLLSACHQHDEEHNHEAPTEHAPTEVVFSDEQIQSIGLTFGKLEQKELSGLLKLNGILKVPNHNKARATSIYGGVVKSLEVQQGSIVKKGQVLATITHPMFLELQQEYLTIKSQLNLGSQAQVAAISHPQYELLQQEYQVIQNQLRASENESASLLSNPQYAELQKESKSLVSKITFAQQEVARQKILVEGNAGALKDQQQAEAVLSELLARQATLSAQMSTFGQATQTQLPLRKKYLEEQMALFTQQTQISLEVKEATLAQQLQQMGINPKSLTKSNLTSSLQVKSPISGTIANLYATIGSFVDNTTPVADIVDNAQLHVDLFVFEQDLPKLKLGQRLNFQLTNAPDKVYQAEIHSIGSSFENISKTVSVHALVEGDKQGLIDGMNVRATVALGGMETTAVPNDAIVNDKTQDFIFIKSPKSITNQTRFIKIPIRKGASEMGYTAITPLVDLPTDPLIVVKQAFFVLAAGNNSGEEGHEH